MQFSVDGAQIIVGSSYVLPDCLGFPILKLLGILKQRFGTYYVFHSRHPGYDVGLPSWGYFITQSNKRLLWVRQTALRMKVPCPPIR